MGARSKNTISLWVPSICSHGGIQTYMRYIWEVLQNDEISDVAGNHYGGVALTDTRIEMVEHAVLKSRDWYSCNSSRVAFFLNVLKLLRANNAVIVGHLNLAPVALLLKRMGLIKKYLIVIHGIECWSRVSLLRRISLHSADVIVATTKYTVEVCSRNNNIPKSKFAVIPLTTKQNLASKIRERSNQVFNILFVGRLEESEKYKGLEHVIEAVQSVIKQGIPCKLTIVGDGDSRQRIQDSVGFPYKKDIAFLGRVSSKEMESIYEKSHLFVMPSSGEGFGIVFLEAMSQGIPCIGGDHGGSPEVIADGVDGYLVKYGKPEILVEKIMNLYFNHELYSSFSKESIRSVDANFSFNKFTDRWNDVIAKLVL
ncbi:glycosyltransferase family 4 protein [Amylibacter sp.]|nr:glycosyltransferase family 4 protein [Amylibacter sp.]